MSVGSAARQGGRTTHSSINNILRRCRIQIVASLKQIIMSFLQKSNKVESGEQAAYSFRPSHHEEPRVILALVRLKSPFVQSIEEVLVSDHDILCDSLVQLLHNGVGDRGVDAIGDVGRRTPCFYARAPRQASVKSARNRENMNEPST